MGVSDASIAKAHVAGGPERQDRSHWMWPDDIEEMLLQSRRMWLQKRRHGLFRALTDGGITLKAIETSWGNVGCDFQRAYFYRYVRDRQHLPGELGKKQLLGSDILKNWYIERVMGFEHCTWPSLRSIRSFTDDDDAYLKSLLDRFISCCPDYALYQVRV